MSAVEKVIAKYREERAAALRALQRLVDRRAIVLLVGDDSQLDQLDSEADRLHRSLERADAVLDFLGGDDDQVVTR
jgi:hypothetical protein